MAKFPVTKSFQINEFPLGWIEINDEELSWLTSALYEQAVEFSTAFKRDPIRGTLTLTEVSIVPAGMRLKHRAPGIVQLEMENDDD